MIPIIAPISAHLKWQCRQRRQRCRFNGIGKIKDSKRFAELLAAETTQTKRGGQP